MILAYWVEDQGPGPEHFKAGDVICFVPDSHQFSSIELRHPSWRMMKVPLTQTECEALTAQPARPQNVSKDTTVALRAYRFNVAQLKAFASASVTDDKRREPVFDATALVAQVRAVAEQKPVNESLPPVVPPVDPKEDPKGLGVGAKL